MPVSTSAIFYRRGVPNSFKDFGNLASANYTVGQPTLLKINSAFFQRNFISTIYQK